MGHVRQSPIRDVLLTNADLDHVLGLFFMREHNQPLRVHCTSSVRETLQNDLRLSLLDSYCGIEWRDVDKSADAQIELGEGLSGNIIYLVGELPRYAKAGSVAGQSIALELIDPNTRRRLVIAPDVAGITPELQQALETADAIIFDGTFWSDDELQKVDSKSRTAQQMGHLPIAGGSLTSIGRARAQHRIYTHINNTNPILKPGTSARMAVESAGVTVGEDGIEFEL